MHECPPSFAGTLARDPVLATHAGVQKKSDGSGAPPRSTHMDGDRDYGHWLGLAMIWALALAGLILASWTVTEFDLGPDRPFGP